MQADDDILLNSYYAVVGYVDDENDRRKKCAKRFLEILYKLDLYT